MIKAVMKLRFTLYFSLLFFSPLNKIKKKSIVLLMSGKGVSPFLVQSWG